MSDEEIRAMFAAQQVFNHEITESLTKMVEGCGELERRILELEKKIGSTV